MATGTDLTAGLGLPGRLGDPGLTLRDDPRADPRMVAALAAFGLDVPGEPPPVSADSPMSDLQAWAEETEDGFEAAVRRPGRRAAPGRGGHVGDHHRARPRRPRDQALRPPPHRRLRAAAVHLPHPRRRDGADRGGRALLRPLAQRAGRHRDGGGGRRVPQRSRQARPPPLPTGLHDCADGLRHVSDHRAELGVSHIVLSGESGGGNLCLSLTHLAKREGWLDVIAGVYAQCPYIAGPQWMDPAPGLTSLVENDGLFISRRPVPGDDRDLRPRRPQPARPHLLAGGGDRRRPGRHAAPRDLGQRARPAARRGHHLLPPAPRRRGQRGGPDVLGTCHGGDVFFATAMPDVHAATIRDISAFAHSLA